MLMKRVLFIAVGLVFLLALMNLADRPPSYPPGILVPDAPLQESVEQVEFMRGDYSLTQRARFELRARVLGREDYSLDRGAELAPLDLALGWGPMSDQAVLDQLEVSQSARWYRLRWDHPPPLPEAEIMGHSGNMHIIPATEFINDVLQDIQEGQLVQLWGYLVDARGNDGFRWLTSLSRSDVGGGSCELFYVERIVLE